MKKSFDDICRELDSLGLTINAEGDLTEKSLEKAIFAIEAKRQLDDSISLQRSAVGAFERWSQENAQEVGQAMRKPKRDTRLGRLRFSTEVVENRAAWKILEYLNFVPLKVECNYFSFYEMLGTSPNFDELEQGVEVPYYYFDVVNDDVAFAGKD